MRIKVKVIPKAHKNSVEKKNSQYIVRTTAVPDGGKANEQVIRLLAKYFHVGSSCIAIKKGNKTRNKVVEIIT